MHWILYILYSLYLFLKKKRFFEQNNDLTKKTDKIDLVLIRENTEGLYVGVEHFIPIDDDPKAVAEASGIITRSGCRRIAKFTFDYAIKAAKHKIKKVLLLVQLIMGLIKNLLQEYF